jgi:hypothetical protein
VTDPWGVVGPGFPDVVAQVFQAGTTLIDDAGLFVYSGAPGPGNLIASIASAGGTDQFGNGYGPGFSSFGALGTTAEITGAVIGMFSGLNVISELTPSGFFLYSPSGGAGNLIASLATAAGADQFGNAYPEGLNVTVGAISGTTFSGADFVIDSTGAYFYTGVPAAGNLLASIASTAVTDPHGNTVAPGGLAIYGAGGQQIFLGLHGTSSVLRFPSGAANELLPFAVASAIESPGAAQFIATALEGPQITLAGHGDWVGVQVNSPAADGSSSANGSIFRVDNAGTVTQVATWDNTGLNIREGSYLPSDGQQYVFGHATTALAAGVPIANGVTSFFGAQFSVEAGVTYRCKMIAKCIQGASAVAQFIGFSGVTTGGGTTQLFYKFIQDGTAQSYSIVTTQSNIGFMTSAAYVATRTFYLEMEGMFTPNAAGIVQMTARGNGGAFTVSPGTFFEIWRT